MRSCVFCKNKNLKTHSLFKFPSNEIIKQAWYKFCGFNATDTITSNLRLCSKHFKEEDFANGCSTAKTAAGFAHLTLNHDAIPTIKKLRRVFSKDILCSSTTASTIQTTNRSSLEPLDDQCILTDLYANSNNSNAIPTVPKLKRILSKDVVYSSTTASNIQTTNAALINKFESSDEDICSTRKIGELRSIGDIIISDLNTPRKAHRILQMVQTSDKKKSKKINILKKKNNYLKKRIKCLEAVLSSLEQGC